MDSSTSNILARHRNRLFQVFHKMMSNIKNHLMACCGLAFKLAKIYCKGHDRYLGNSFTTSNGDINIRELFSGITKYYINLDGSPDRNNRLISEFSKYQLSNFKRVPAINGALIDNKLNDKIDGIEFDTLCYRNHTSLELACTLSHLKAIKLAHTDGNKVAIMVEDDVVLDLMEVISQVPTFPVDWEIVSFHSWHPSYNNPDRYVNFKTQRCYSTAMYVINRLGMERILRKVNMLSGNRAEFVTVKAKKLLPDHYLYAIANTYFMNPPIVNTSNDHGAYESQIHPSHTEQHIQMQQSLIGFYNNK